MTDTLVGFANLDIIRITQASPTPSIRDSVPPTSALRFDPSKQLSRKREREGSARPNGSPSSSGWQPSKRQRVSDLDPDKPLPSRELNVGGTINEEDEPRDEIIPNSQREAVYERNNGNSRHVRDDPRISETPSPPPELPSFVPFENGSADCQGRKSNVPDTNEPLNSQLSIQSPFGPAMLRAQDSARSKSASYHIQRATERGISVSTAATSPLSGDQQGAATNGSRTSNKRKLSDPILEAPKINGKPSSTSTNGDSIYENVPSDSEFHDVLKRTADKLKPKKSSPSGLPGLDWAKKFNTPPNGRRRTSRSQDRIVPNGELPLTPNSKEREERQRQNEQADEAKQARRAAAAAAEQRKREANEARAAEQQERTRQLREKSDREAQEKRNSVLAKAARLEKERVEQMERDRKDNVEREAENDRPEQQGNRQDAELAQLEREKQATVVRERHERERFEGEERARKEKERKEAARLEREKAMVAEAERGQEKEAQRQVKETALAVEATRKSREPSEQSKASTPDRSKATPIRPQSSSTAFIPSGRKSALKAPSSQAAGSSSPVLARTVSADSSNVSQADLPPTETKRRVSFLDEAPDNETPKAKPSRTPILPPSKGSAFKATPKSAIKAPTGKQLTITIANTLLTDGFTVGIAKHSSTPILPPSMKRSSKERSTILLVQSAIAPPQLGVNPKPAATKVLPPVTKSISPAARSSSQNRETPNASIKSKGMPCLVRSFGLWV